MKHTLKNLVTKIKEGVSYIIDRFVNMSTASMILLMFNIILLVFLIITTKVMLLAINSRNAYYSLYNQVITENETRPDVDTLCESYTEDVREVLDHYQWAYEDLASKAGDYRWYVDFYYDNVSQYSGTIDGEYYE